MSLEETPEKSEKDTSPTQSNNIGYLIETVKQLQIEAEALRLESRKRQKTHSGTLTFAFLATGISALAASVLTGSQILAFIGLSFTFWGALFIFITPVKFVQSSLLEPTALSSYSTIDRIVRELKYRGESYYIPSFPKDIYLPEHLKGLKEMIVFISSETGTQMPSIDEMAQGRFHMKPKGICVAPPGLGLATRFEAEAREDFTNQEIGKLCMTLSEVIPENLQLAKEAHLKPTFDRSQVQLVLQNSVYKTLYDPKLGLRSVHKLGCPIVSAVACALAKASGRPVTIAGDRVSPDLNTIEAWYRFVGD